MATVDLSHINPIYAGFLVAALVLIAIEVLQERRRAGTYGLAWWGLGALTVVQMLFLLYTWVDRIGLNLQPSQAEQSTVALMQHVMRGEMLYHAWTDATILTYPPLYFVISVPFSVLFGANLATLRLVSVLGTVAAGMILLRTVQEKTGSRWWAMIGLGLYTTVVGLMETYLGTASPEPWLLCCVLLGTYLIDHNRSMRELALGVLVLSNAVWAHQLGMVFLIGALVFLTWRHGIQVTEYLWALAVGLTILAWVTIGPMFFGDQFLNFTTVQALIISPFSLEGIAHYATFVTGTYPLLALVASLTVIFVLLRQRYRVDIWMAQFIAAVFVGLISMLFSGSASMLVIPTVWFILIGLQALQRWSQEISFTQRLQLHTAALFASFLVVYRV